MSSSRTELHWGRLLRCYAERPPTVAEMLHASFAAAPSELALVEGDTRLTYAQLDALSARLAAHLAARGIRTADRVALILDNGLDVVLCVVALARLGAILVPLGTRLRRSEISFIFEDAEPVAVIYHAQYGGELPSLGPAADLRFDASSEHWSALLKTDAAAPLPRSKIAEEDVFGILYTSGTTGKPKGAMLTHLNVVHSCLHWQEAHDLKAAERTILCVPWSHVAGLCGVLLPFLHVRGTLVLVAEFKRRGFLQLAQRERITHALMVPAMYRLCLLEPDLASFDLAEWRIAAYGSAPMPEPTIRRFAEVFPRLQMANCYGATETTSPATIMPLGEGVAHKESVGKVVRCGDIRVMTDAGTEVPSGDEGELWIGGPMVVPGYWRNPAADAASFAAGYWKSGDIGAVDAQGYVRIADRKKDMINRGGFKIYPAEVESVLADMEGVIESAVIGLPDEILGESVVAFLSVDNESLTPNDVRAWCAQRMADYKVPGRVELRRGSLPRNANGKIQKAELRALATTIAADTARKET